MPCVHRTFHDVFADLREDQWPYYLPDSWVPHCTLAINIKWEEVHKALDNVYGITGLYAPKSIVWPWSSTILLRFLRNTGSG